MKRLNLYEKLNIYQFERSILRDTIQFMYSNDMAASIVSKRISDLNHAIGLIERIMASEGIRWPLMASEIPF